MQSNVEILYGVEVFKMVMIFFKIVSVFVAFSPLKYLYPLKILGKTVAGLSHLYVTMVSFVL